MNLAQSLGAAAAALVLGLSTSGAAPAQTISALAEMHASRLNRVAERVACQFTFALSFGAGVREHSALPDAHIHQARRTVRV